MSKDLIGVLGLIGAIASFYAWAYLWYFPALTVLKSAQRLTGEEFVSQYPAKAWVNRWGMLFVLPMLFVFASLFIVTMSNFPSPVSFVALFPLGLSVMHFPVTVLEPVSKPVLT